MEIIKKEKENKNLESTRGNSYRSPECDIYENDEGYIIYFDVPGVEKKDINIKVEKDTLILIADCSKQPGDGYQCIRDEMLYSGFKRSFQLGNSVDTAKIEAEYNKGSLRLHLPKKEEQKTKQIKIKVGK